MEKKTFPRIGPGLGTRTRIWNRVQQRLPISIHSESVKSGQFSQSESRPKGLFTSDKIEDEKRLVGRLSDGENWSDLIPSEWIDIYSAYYDETKDIPLPDREIVKIDKDVPRTFGLFVRNARNLRLNFPADLQPLYDGLREVLIAVSRDRGYCQGINFIAALILLQTSNVQKSAVILNFILKHRKLEILFDPRYSALMDYMKLFEKRLRKFVPNVYHHFKRHDFSTVSYAIEWFTTCFIVTSPGELSHCVVDLLVAGVDDAMIRVGLGLLKVLERDILRLDFEGLHQQFKHLVMTIDPCDVMVEALPITVPRRMSVLEGMSLKIDALEPTSNGNLKFSTSGGIIIPNNIDNAEDCLSSSSIEEDDSKLSDLHDSADQENSEHNSKSTKPKFSQRIRHQMSSSAKAISTSMKKALKFKKSSSKSPRTEISTSASATANSAAATAASSVQSPVPDVSSSSKPLLQGLPVTVSSSAESATTPPAVATTGNAITTWWNNTWQNTLFVHNHNPSVEKPTSVPAIHPALSTPVVASSSAGAKAGNHSLPQIDTSEKMLKASSSISPHGKRTNPIVWKNSLSPKQSSKSPVGDTIIPNGELSLPAVGKDYDGDTESDESSKVETTETQKSTAQSGESSPMSQKHIMSALNRHENQRRYRLLLLEHSDEQYAEQNMEDTYLDQGGEIIDSLQSASLASSSAQNQPVPANFRIALALSNLKEDWFPEQIHRRKAPSNNLIIRQKHKNSKKEDAA